MAKNYISKIQLIGGVYDLKDNDARDNLLLKQNTLSPGRGINITNDTISSTITEYDDSEVRSEISNIGDDVTTVKGNIITIQTDLSSKVDQDDFETLSGEVDGIHTKTNTLEATVQNLDNEKQDVLSAGAGISLNGTVISSTVTQYDDTEVRGLISANSSSITSTQDRVSATETSISTLNGTGTGSVTEKVNNGIAALNSSASIASVTSGVVTIKGSVVESHGTINNGSDSDVVLSKVSTSGLAEDLDVTYSSARTDLQSAVTDINSRIHTLENRQQISNIVCNPESKEIPAGAIYKDETQTITGTMDAVDGIEGAIYMVKNYDGQDTFFEQYIVSNNESSKSWQHLGSTKTSLTGFIKDITINAKTFTGDGNNSVELPNFLTDIRCGGDRNWDNNHTTLNIASDIIDNGKRELTMECQIETASDIAAATSTSDGYILATTLKQYIEDECLTEFRTYDD